MIITCPECATRYKTTEDAIGPNGRTVRCASCTTTWFVPAPSAELTMDALALADNEREDMVPAPKITKPIVTAAAGQSDDVDDHSSNEMKAGAHVDMRQKTDRRRRNRRLRGVLAIWLVPLSIMAAGAYGAYHFRQDIVQKHPKAATLYKAVGVDVSLSGLMLDPPETRYAEIDGVPTLIVKGSVRNISDGQLSLPMVELSLHNSNDEMVVSWVVDLDKSVLPKGGRTDYTTQKPNPALDAVTLKTRFIDETTVPTITPIEMPDEGDTSQDAEN
ncbi:DUF3426 domain-containing protein [Fretibacter rubidus]|uniref:DUF3426 domain-containing protein n=1 Tax=Fretibacter rubidus TaxID=570162 RepID=UPI00352AB102